MPATRPTSSVRKAPAANTQPALKFTVPGMTLGDATKVTKLLQERLNALNDLALTLKHVHWNVVGPHFIAVHKMLDPQIDAIRAMADTTAERIATLGGVPIGTPGALVEQRSWTDYSLGRATTQEHLGALDQVFTGVIADHRAALDEVEKPDPVSHDMLIGQLADLELFHWFIRAHYKDTSGALATTGTDSEMEAAKAAEKAFPS